MADQVATPATEATTNTQATPVNASPSTPSNPATTTTAAPVVPGTQTQQTPANANTPAQPAPAGSKPLTEADLNAALRKQQAAYDRQMAQLHQRYQQEQAQQQRELLARLQRDYQFQPDELQGYQSDLELQRKAQQYDAIQKQAADWQAWYDYVATVATTHGLQPSDPRLANATDATDLMAKAREALRQDAEAERTRILGTTQAAAASALGTEIANGEHDALDGAPSTTGGLDLSKYTPEDAGDLYRLGAQEIQRNHKRRQA